MLNIDNQLRRLIGVLATAQDYVYRAQAVPTWTSADGRVIPITEMDDRHLQNAINLIERGAPHSLKRARVLPALHAESERRRVVKLRAQGRGPDGYGLGATTGRTSSAARPADAGEVAALQLDHRGLLRRVQILERKSEQDAPNYDHAIGEALKRTRDLREWYTRLQATFDSTRALMCQRCGQTEQRLSGLEAAGSERDAFTTRLHARLEAVEAVAHKPQPVLSLEVFGRALRRTFDDFGGLDWRSRFIKRLAENCGVDVSRW